MVKVRLFAAAADILGAEEIILQASTAIELRQKLTENGGTTVDSVIQRCSILIDGVRAESNEAPILQDSNVDILPPFAGG